MSTAAALHADCDAVAEALALGGSPLPDALQRHVAGCAGCAELVRFDTALRGAGTTGAAAAAGARAASSPSPLVPSPLVPSPELREALARDHAPVRGFSAWRRAAPPLATAVVLCAAVAALIPRHNIAEQVPWLFWTTFALGIAAVCAGLWLVLDRGPSGVGRPAIARWVYLLLAGAAFETLAWHPAHHTEPRLSGETGMHSMLGCVVSGALAALLVGLVVFRTARRSSPTNPGAAGAAAGAAAGFAAAVALQLHCASSHPLHVGLSHATPVAFGALLGWVAGRRTMAP